MKKFSEIYDSVGQCGPRIGWEVDACYELERTAESSEGTLRLVSNNGMFDAEAKGTYTVGISMNDTGDFTNHRNLTKEQAKRIFESYLE